MTTLTDQEVTDRGPSGRDGASEATAVVQELRTCTDPGRAGQLRQQLVLLHLGIATGIALRYRNRGEQLEELIQVARLGLVKAADRFDPTRGDFAAYAVPTVAGEVKRHFRDHGWAIRPPRRIQELRVEVAQASEELSQQLGRSPRISELARHLAVSVDEVAECLGSNDLYHLRSLDALVAPGGEDLTVADTFGEPDARLELVEQAESIKPLLAKLPARDRRILALRFFAGWTQEQIAGEIGVTQMQVSRLLDRILQRLRAEVSAA